MAVARAHQNPIMVNDLLAQIAIDCFSTFPTKSDHYTGGLILIAPD